MFIDWSKKNVLLKLKQKSLRYLILRTCEILRISVCQGLSLLFFKIKSSIHSIEYGKNIQIYGNVLIRGPGKIMIGNNVSMISSSWRANAASISQRVRFRTFMRPTKGDNKIIIGDGVELNGTSITARSRTIYIGNNTIFAADCIIMDSDFHLPWPPEHRVINPGFEFDQDVMIGSNVWVGARSIILKGVTIGDNSVIAAGSVVVKSIPANALAAGNPAKIIKYYTEDRVLD